MMRYPISGLCCMLVFLFGPMASAQSGELELFSLSDPSGATLQWFVSEKRLCSTKPWSPETQAPPLTPTQAVQAAIKARAPKKQWIVTGISISAAGCGGEFRWYYGVDMYDSGDIAAGNPPDSVKQVVLMDGSILAPRPPKR